MIGPSTRETSNIGNLIPFFNGCLCQCPTCLFSTRSLTPSPFYFLYPDKSVGGLRVKDKGRGRRGYRSDVFWGPHSCESLVGLYVSKETETEVFVLDVSDDEEVLQEEYETTTIVP